MTDTDKSPMEELTIEDLIPHREGMKLIDEILSFDDHCATTKATAHPDWPLTKDNTTHIMITIELVAQTAGVTNGWELLKRYGKDSERLGWIVGIKKANFFHDAISSGTPLITYAENTFAFDKFREIKGFVMIDDRKIAEITLQLVQAKEQT